MDQPQSTTPPQTQSPKRSASYPSLTVQQAYNFASRVNEKFGLTEVTRKEIAAVLNVHDGTISREVAAVAAYGFFDKFMKKGESDFRYKLTKSFNDIFMPENEKEKKVTFIEAFGKPKIFNDLINKFDGSVIPEELSNTLIKHHGITPAASKEVASIFIQSGKEVGVINDARVLNYRVVLNATQKTQFAEIIEEQPQKESQQNSQVSHNLPVRIDGVNFNNSEDMKVPIHLTKNKIAYLVYPNDINDKDIKLLDHAIKGILLRLNLESDEDEIPEMLK